MPTNSKAFDKETTDRISDEIKTVMALEVAENPLLSKFIPKDKELSKLLIRSIASSIYYFPVCA